MGSITANSEPDYDSWGWDQYWSCSDWMEWHRQLKSAYGLDEANRRFIKAFHKAGFGAASYDCRSFNSTFRSYARENGFLNALYEGLGGLIASPIGVVTDVGNAVGTGVSNIAGGIKNASGLLKGLLPVALVLVFIIGILYVYNKANA